MWFQPLPASPSPRFFITPRFSPAGMVRIKNNEKWDGVFLIWNPGQVLTAGCKETPGKAHIFISDQSKLVFQESERRRKFNRCIESAMYSPRRDSRSARRDSRSARRDSRSARRDSRSARRDSRSARRDSRLFFQAFWPLGGFQRVIPRWKAWDLSKTRAPFLFQRRQGN